MANPEHLEILDEGVKIWNQWRKENPSLQPDLEGADLQRAELQGADLRGAELQGADLRGAILQGANLKGAILQGAKLQEANLQEANLQGVNLQEANLQGANLQGANIKGVYLLRRYLQEVSLKESYLKLKGAIILGKPGTNENQTFGTESITQKLGNTVNLNRKFEINQPCLNAEEYAKALATVFSSAKGEVCFALFGHWGRGKTYLMKLVEKELSLKQYDCVWFSAWKYHKKPEIWIYLYETLRLKATNSNDGLINIIRKLRIFLVKNPRTWLWFLMLFLISLTPLGNIGVIIFILTALIYLLGASLLIKLGFSLFGTWRNISMITGL